MIGSSRGVNMSEAEKQEGSKPEADTQRKQKVNTSRSRWTMIRVPEEVRDLVKDIADKDGRAQWKVVLEAVSLYDSFRRRPKTKSKLPLIEKTAWYITKLATSFGAFKENPNEPNFKYLKERVEELRDRLSVDADILLKMAEYYMATNDQALRTKIKIDMNTAFKQVVKDLITTQLFELESIVETTETTTESES